MQKYILILSDRSERMLHDWFASCAEALRQVSSTSLAIQPHILLLQSESSSSEILGALPTKLHPSAQAILLHLGSAGWWGTSNIERYGELARFFEDTTP